jgi:hypothetical protein
MSQLKYYNSDTEEWEPAIVGAEGPEGPQGPAGENGTVIVSSTSLPTAGDGDDGDLWIVYS